MSLSPLCTFLSLKLSTELEQLTIRTTLELDVKRGDDDDDVGSGFPNLTRLALDLSNVDGSVSIEPYSNAFWTRPETTCPRLEHLSLSLDLSPVDCRLVADAWGRTLRSSTLTNRLKVLDLARSNHSQFVIESLLVDRSDDSTFRRFENLRHLSIESPVRLSNRARRKRPPPPPLGGEWSKFLYDAAGINLDSLDLYLDPLSSDPNDADYYEDDDDDDSEDYHRGGQEDEELEEVEHLLRHLAKIATRSVSGDDDLSLFKSKRVCVYGLTSDQVRDRRRRRQRGRSKNDDDDDEEGEDFIGIEWRTEGEWDYRFY